MTSDQLEFTEGELLADHPALDPLVVDGVTCHGGFAPDGIYVSPRTLNRVPAIEAWERQRIEQFGTPILDIGLDTWPESFPNVEQTKLLLSSDVREPTISTFTRIGTVEGFGAMLRLLPIPDWTSVFDEDVTGTAIDHLGRGLFEAHARDEAGDGEVAGHDRMWFAARDLAFEHPVTEDQQALMLERMGITSPGGGPGPLAAPPRLLPDDIDQGIEFVITRMVSLLFIEISAFHGFAWAEAVLSDTELVAGDGAAAEIIAHIRADETPHVSYLATVLSEMRDRTWIGASGLRYDGATMIGTLWDGLLAQSTGPRRAALLASTMGEIEHALTGRSDADDVIEEMLSLGSVRRLADGTLVEPEIQHISGHEATAGRH
jgi:hypothetical protein